MKPLQFNIRSLLAVSLFASLFLSAISGVFGEHVETTTVDLSLFVTVAVAWVTLQLATYAAVIAPLVLAVLVAQRLRSRSSTP